MASDLCQLCGAMAISSFITAFSERCEIRSTPLVADLYELVGLRLAGMAVLWSEE